MTDAGIARMPSPVGELLLLANPDGLSGVWFETSRHGRPQVTEWPDDDGQGRAGAVLALAREQLEEYFAGRRTVFDLPLAPQGTPFQLRVWHALRAIPYGTTESYGGLARRIGTPTSAARAVRSRWSRAASRDTTFAVSSRPASSLVRVALRASSSFRAARRGSTTSPRLIAATSRAMLAATVTVPSERTISSRALSVLSDSELPLAKKSPKQTAKYSGGPGVVVDGDIVTASGPDRASEFGRTRRVGPVPERVPPPVPTPLHYPEAVDCSFMSAPHTRDTRH